MTTLTTYTTTYVAERRRRGEITSRTAKNLRYCLDGFDQSFGNRPLSQLSTRTIERWLESIGHLAPSTRRNHLSAVRAFCAWLVDRKVVKTNPTDKTPPIRQPRSVPRAMQRSDVARLLAVLPDMRAQTIITLMVGCGLRCIEVARLSVTDYDPVAATIEVSGKGLHERVIPVPAEVAAVLDRYLSTVGVVSGPLIRSTRVRSQGLSAETISTYVSRWMDEAGVKVAPWDGRSAHALRHTAASDVLDVCGDLRVVQAMLGHAHLSSTSIYLRRARLDQLRAAMEGRDYSSGGSPPELRRVA